MDWLRSPRRSGFNLLEIMVAMFILALGLMMIAGSLPVGLKQASDSQDLSMSSFAARIGVAHVRQFSSRRQLPVWSSAVDAESVLETAAAYPCQASVTTSTHWFGPNSDIHANGAMVAGVYVPGAAGTYRWFRSIPAWGQAIPIPFDERYAFQIFYRRLPTIGGDAVNGPFVYTISFVVQAQRDGLFSRPVTEGEMRAASPPAGASAMGADDLYCTPDGVWRRYGKGDITAIPAGTFGWGIPGSMGVFETTLAF